MPIKIDKIVEGGVLALNDLKYSREMIVKHFRQKGKKICAKTVSNIINCRGKRREAAANKENFKQVRVRPVRTKELVKRVDSRVSSRNPPSQRALARQFGCAPSTINNAIRIDCNRAKAMKPKVHKLNADHIDKRFKRCQILLENEVTDDRLEFCVTLDESWLYLDSCNGQTDHVYVKRGEKVPENWMRERPDAFGKKIMAVGVLTGRGPGPLFFVPPKTKVDSQFYCDYVLKPLVRRYLPKIYPGELHKVWVHHDAASSHTSGDTDKFAKLLTASTGVRFIESKHIPIKGQDCSPCDFFAFGYLKSRLSKRRAETFDGLMRAARQEWATISEPVVKRVFQSWKRRMEMIVKMKGHQIENVKSIHSKSVSQFL